VAYPNDAVPRRIAPANASVAAIAVLLLGFGGTAGFVGPGAGR